jgi:hypothetical protein
MVGGIDSEGEQLMDVSIERASHCNECRDQTRRWSGLSWTGKQGVRLFLFFFGVGASSSHSWCFTERREAAAIQEQVFDLSLDVVIVETRKVVMSPGQDCFRGARIVVLAEEVKVLPSQVLRLLIGKTIVHHSHETLFRHAGLGLETRSVPTTVLEDVGGLLGCPLLLADRTGLALEGSDSGRLLSGTASGRALRARAFRSRKFRSREFRSGEFGVVSCC